MIRYRDQKNNKIVKIELGKFGEDIETYSYNQTLCLWNRIRQNICINSMPIKQFDRNWSGLLTLP